MLYNTFPYLIGFGIVFYLLWKYLYQPILFTYTKVKLLTVKSDLLQFFMENNYSLENELFVQFSKDIELINSNISMLNFSDFYKYKKNISKEEIKRFNKEEEKRYSNHPKAIQNEVRRSYKKVRDIIRGQMIFRNFWYCLLLLLISLVVIPYALIKYKKSSYEDECQKISAKYISNEIIPSYVDSKYA